MICEYFDAASINANCACVYMLCVRLRAVIYSFEFFNAHRQGLRSQMRLIFVSFFFRIFPLGAGAHCTLRLSNK